MNIKENIENIIDKASKELKYPYLNFDKKSEIDSFNKIIKNFLEDINDKKLKEQFVKEINNIKTYNNLDKFIMLIANINYEKKFSIKHTGIKFLLLCAGIESFFNLNNINEDYTKKFTSFLSNIPDEKKNIIKENFKINKKLSDKKIIKKFCRYIYQKRSQFVHEGTHFNFNETSGYIDRYLEDDIRIELKLKFEEFENIVISATLYNLKKINEEYNK